MVEDLMQDNTQENSSGQGFKESIDEDERKALYEEKDHVLEEGKVENTSNLNPNENIDSTEWKQSSTCVQEISTKVSVVADLKGKVLLVQEVKSQNKSLLKMGESK